MIGIVVVAHGGFAAELLKATEHVIGSLPAARAIGLGPKDDLAQRLGPRGGVGDGAGHLNGLLQVPLGDEAGQIGEDKIPLHPLGHSLGRSQSLAEQRVCRLSVQTGIGTADIAQGGYPRSDLRYQPGLLGRLLGPPRTTPNPRNKL